MAAPSYTHDLTDWIIDSDIAAWAELTGANAGALPDEADTESALQGTNTTSQANNTTGLCGIGRAITPINLTAGHVFLVWHGHGVATALQTYANNGLRIAIGSDTANWKFYTVGGYDVPPFPYGKWVNNPCDPQLTADGTGAGTPPTGGTGIGMVGSVCQLTLPVAKGQPHVVDMIRYGRAESRFVGGDLANGYATFAGYAALNDAQTARWGLIQAVQGGYQWKGLMTIGFGGACDFRDTNKNIFVQDTRKVSATFNAIEIRNAATNVSWTGINFASIGTTSKGMLTVFDNATVTLNGCTFTDMSTFSFSANTTITGGTVFRRCGDTSLQSSTVGDCLFTFYSKVTALDTAFNGSSFKNVPATNDSVVISSAGGSPTYSSQAATDGATTTATSLAVTVPTNTSGDLLFMSVVVYSTTGSVLTESSVTSQGWTLLGKSLNTNSDNHYLFYKVAGTEPASYTITCGSARIGANIYAYTGSYNPSNPIDVVSNTPYRTNNTTLQAAAMTVTNTNSRILFFGCLYATAANNMTPPTAPAAFTEPVADSGNVTSDVWREHAHLLWTGSGTTGLMNGTLATATTTKHAFAVAINPSLPGQSTTTFANAIIDTSLVTAGNNWITVNDPSAFSYCDFTGGGGHAILIDTPGTYTFSGNQFTGYGANGTTGAAIYNNSGGAVTLNITNGGSTPTVRNGTSATTTINNAVTLEINGVSAGNGVDTGTACAVFAIAGGPETAGTQLMNEFSDATGTAQATYIYQGVQPVVIRARQAGFTPFTTNGTITAAGLTVTAVWQADPMYGL